MPDANVSEREVAGVTSRIQSENAHGTLDEHHRAEHIANGRRVARAADGWDGCVDARWRKCMSGTSNNQFSPRFVRRYAQMDQAFRACRAEVKDGRFPSINESY
jgi:hypothetical protein